MPGAGPRREDQQKPSAVLARNGAALARLERHERPAAAVHHLVADGVSLEIRQGEFFGLLGPNGAGKSTLINILAGLVTKSEGTVDIWGFNVDQHPRNAKLSIGVVPQEPTLFSGTVRENIAYAIAGRGITPTDSEIEAAARAANAHDFVVRLPDGYATKVGERGVKLSGGQRQRLAIARVFLKNPALVILDEATASLDSTSEAAVAAALEEALTGRTVLVIAHRLSTIRAADLILVVEGGQIVERGTHVQLLAAGGRYEELNRTQFAEAATTPELVRAR